MVVRECRAERAKAFIDSTDKRSGEQPLKLRTLTADVWENMEVRAARAAEASARERDSRRSGERAVMEVRNRVLRRWRSREDTAPSL